MPVLPENRLEQIQFCESHITVWTGAPTAIGLTAAQVTQLNNAAQAARQAYIAAINARQSSKAATGSYYSSVSTMRDIAADLIRQIKAFAELQAKPDLIYTAAQIPQPLPPSPLPAPGQPTAIGVTLEPTGAVTLSWEAINATSSLGAFFNVYRKLPGMAGFTRIGGAPGATNLGEGSRRMKFTDDTIPAAAAAAGVQYVIQGQRGPLLGTPCAAITVQFGSGGVVNVQGASLSLAA